MLRPGRGSGGTTPGTTPVSGTGGSSHYTAPSPYSQPSSPSSPSTNSHGGYGGRPAQPSGYHHTTASSSSYGSGGGTGYGGGGAGGSTGYHTSGYHNRGHPNSNNNNHSGGYAGGGYTANGHGYGGSSSHGAAYGGYTNAAASSYSSNSNSHNDTGEYKGKKRKPKQNMVVAMLSKLSLSTTISILVSLCFLATTVRYKRQQSNFLTAVGAQNLQQVVQTIQSGHQDTTRLRKELQTMRESYRSASERTSAKDKEVRRLTAELMEARSQPAPPDMEKVQQREEAWKNQVILLQEATSREARRAALEKFGTGPYFAEFTVSIPNAPKDNRHQTFIVELAPLETMPHAVHLFLEQVTHGLWNRAWFYINGPHVLQAGPKAKEEDLEEAMREGGEDERTLALRPFRELQLDTLAFPEYSEDYPHLPWTLGYTGRPGGPDFYINKVDNSVAHGPGGQFHHELEEFADSCFAKVVSGFETLKAMSEVSTIREKNEFQYFYEEPINIVQVKQVEDPFQPIKREDPPVVDPQTLQNPDKPDRAPEHTNDNAQDAKQAAATEEESWASSSSSRRKRGPNRKKFKPVIEHNVEP